MMMPLQTFFFALICLQGIHTELTSRQSHIWVWGLLLLKLRKAICMDFKKNKKVVSTKCI